MALWSNSSRKIDELDWKSEGSRPAANFSFERTTLTRNGEEFGNENVSERASALGFRLDPKLLSVNEDSI